MIGRKKKNKIPKVDGCIAAFAALLAIIVFSVGFAPVKSTETASEPVPVEQKVEEPKTEEKKPEPAKLEDLKAHFIDVGQGDSELVQLPDGKVMLIDAGEASAGSAVVDYLKEQDVDKIDYLVATHPHADHIGGMEAVLDAFEVGEVWMPDASEDTATYTDFLDAVEKSGADVEQAENGKAIDDADAYDVNVLAPKDGVQSDDMNDYSAIIRVTFADTTMLFTGDASASEIVEADPGQVDVLKAAHHGSETGTNTEVVNTLKPVDVIMSYAEGNEYGHPDQSVLDAISAEGATAYSTAANGDIVVTSNGTDIGVSTSKSGAIVAGVSAAEKAKQEEEARAKAEAEEKAKQEAEAAAAAQAQAEAEAQAQAQAQQQQQQQQQETVYITPTGSKYHRQGCRTLSRTKNPTPMSKQDAINNGYQPCGVCNP